MNTKLNNLPLSEKLRLVEDLWDSIATDQGALPLTSEQKDLLDKRISAYESDGQSGRPAEDVIEELHKRL